MFQFSRRTLWIIMFVTIPLIVFLDSLGRDAGDASASLSSSRDQAWSMDGLSLEPRGRLQWLDLSGSDEIRISVISDLQPANSLGLISPDAFQQVVQGGRHVVTIVNPVNVSSVRSSLEIIQSWLPANANSEILVSGPYSDRLAEQIEPFIDSWQGSGEPISITPVPALTRLSSPQWGTSDQLAFLVWISILQQRLAGLSIQTSWDHRSDISVVTFNSTLAPDVLGPVTTAELEPVLAAYVRSANQRERRQEQLHRYAVTAVVYGLSFDYFINQPQRLAALTLSQINTMREVSRAQIQR